MTRRICGPGTLALVLVLSVPSIARADVTLGSISQPSGSAQNAGASPGTYVQASSASFPVAVPAGGGRITQWSMNTTGSTAGATVQLVVVRPAGGTNYTVIAVDTKTLPNPLPVSGVATFIVATPIPVNAGDHIGINTPTGNAIADWSGGSTPSTDVISIESTSPTPSAPAVGQSLQSYGTGPGVRANVSAVVSQSVDVGVTTSTAPSRPSVGNLAVLGSTVTSHSAGSVPVTFTDTVPAGLRINSAFADNGSCSVSGQTVTCALSNVPSGGSVPVNILVTPAATGSYANHVSVAASGALIDTNPADNSATATLTVRKLATNACTVPKLRGARPTGAVKRVLKQLGCTVKVKRKRGKGVPRGAVLNTKPGPGTYRLGSKITLIVRK